MQRAGYEGTVIGYSWDSDIAGKLGFGLAEDCADKNAPKLARFLTEYRRACPNGVLRLVSHSLGARVIMETLKVLEANKSGIKIDSVHMLGAAIDNEAPTREWPASYRAFANRVGHTFNYWNSDDPVLTFAYPGWPLGESGVEWGNTPPKNYTDIKVTAQAGSSHSNYMAVAAWVVNDMYKARKPDDGSSGGGGDGGNDGDGGSRFSNGDQVESTTDLNTRARPDTGSSVRVTVSPGTTGKITGGPTQEGGYTWWKVQWETGVQGWSAGRYLTPGTGGGSGSFSDGDRVASTTNLNTRHRPGLDSRVLKTMSPGAVGEIMNGPVRKDGYTWWGVHWLEDDLWGWSAGRYLKKK